MAVKEILLLGNPQLNEISSIVKEDEITDLKNVVNDLRDTMLDFRNKHGFGRAIAAPQIGVQKRLFYMHIPEQIVFINPAVYEKSNEIVEVWDDCMSFPDLFVKVRRHNKIKIDFKDMDWKDNTLEFSGDLALLIQQDQLSNHGRRHELDALEVEQHFLALGCAGRHLHQLFADLLNPGLVQDFGVSEVDGQHTIDFLGLQ